MKRVEATPELQGIRPPQGFSVIELLVALVLTLVVLAAAGGAVRSATVAARRFAAAADRHDGLRIAFDLFSRQVRLAGYDPAAIGIPPLDVAGPGLIAIHRDLDGNGSIDGRSRERTGFRRSADGTGLLSVVGHQAMPIVAPLRGDGFTLRYLDAEGRWITEPDGAARRSVRQVAFRIVAGSRGSAARQVLSSSVGLRNRPGAIP